MKRITLLAAVLMLSAVTGHEKDNFTDDEAETEPPINDNGKPISKRETVLCGLTKNIETHIKREDSRFNDEETSDDNDDEFLSLDKILGGTYATYGEIPWMVQFLYYGQQLCGGAILSEFWVITASHCMFSSNVNDYAVVVGDHRGYYNDSHEIRHKAARIIRHELHVSGSKFNNDIALVKIKPTDDGRGIRFNNYVQPICLPDSTDRPPPGTPMLFTGRGYTFTNGTYGIRILKKAILPVTTYADCESAYGYFVTPNYFCAGEFHGDTDVCGGDSGGPLAYRSKGSYTLYGIDTFGTDCPMPNYPSAFVSVPVYRGWIDTNIRLNSNGSEADLPVRRVAVA